MKNTKEKIIDALEEKSEIETELRELFNELKKGETLHYWYDIADRFDEYKNEKMNEEIVEEYNRVLDKLEEEGIIKYKKDENGNDNIIVKK